MAKRSSKKKIRSRSRRWRISAPFAAVRDWPWSTIRLYSIGAAWFAGLVLLVLAWVMGVPRLKAAVAEIGWRGDHSVEFADAPKWVNGDLLAMLELTALRQLSGDPLNQSELVAVRNALLSTGWFDSIEQVRRVHCDFLRVRATFAKPFSVIRDGEGDHLTDPTGRLLPRTYAHGEAGRFVVILGAHFDRPQRPGVQWDGADVTAALRLLRLIEAKPWRGQVDAVDAGVYLAQETLTLVTDRGTRIIWGSAPGEEAPGEATAARKLSYLDYQSEHMGHIDGGYEGQIDVTSPNGVFAR